MNDIKVNAEDGSTIELEDRLASRVVAMQKVKTYYICMDYLLKAKTHHININDMTSEEIATGVKNTVSTGFYSFTADATNIYEFVTMNNGSECILIEESGKYKLCSREVRLL